MRDCHWHRPKLFAWSPVARAQEGSGPWEWFGSRRPFRRCSPRDAGTTTEWRLVLNHMATETTRHAQVMDMKQSLHKRSSGPALDRMSILAFLVPLCEVYMTCGLLTPCPPPQELRSVCLDDSSSSGVAAIHGRRPTLDSRTWVRVANASTRRESRNSVRFMQHSPLQVDSALLQLGSSGTSWSWTR